MAIGVGFSIFRHIGEQPSSEKLVQAMDRTWDRRKKGTLGELSKIVFFQTLAYWRIFSRRGVLNTPKSYWLATLLTERRNDKDPKTEVLGVGEERKSTNKIKT